MKKRWTFLLHIKIVYGLRVCHDFDQRSFEQVQGHQKEKCKNLNSVHIFYRETLKVLTLQKDCLWLRGCHDLGPSSRLMEGKVQTLCLVFNDSYWESLKVLTSHKDCLIWPDDVSWFWPKFIWASTRSLEKNNFHNYVRSTPFLWRKIGLHIKVALKELIMRVCHEFDQVQL